MNLLNVNPQQRDFLFKFSGVLPILLLLLGIPPNPSWLYSLFVLIHTSKLRFRSLQNLALLWRFILLVTCFGLLLAFMGWLSNAFLENISTDTSSQILLSLGFYPAWGLAWWIILQIWQFQLIEIFALHGLFGVFIEQGISDPFFSVLIFLAYGAVIAIAVTLLASEPINTGWRTHWLRYPIAFVIIAIIGVILFLVWGTLLTTLSIIPTDQFGDYLGF